jgi:hypothetical protein
LLLNSSNRTIFFIFASDISFFHPSLPFILYKILKVQMKLLFTFFPSCILHSSLLYPETGSYPSECKSFYTFTVLSLLNINFLSLFFLLNWKNFHKHFLLSGTFQSNSLCCDNIPLDMLNKFVIKLPPYVVYFNLTVNEL